MDSFDGIFRIGDWLVAAITTHRLPGSLADSPVEGNGDKLCVALTPAQLSDYMNRELWAHKDAHDHSTAELAYRVLDEAIADLQQGRATLADFPIFESSRPTIGQMRDYTLNGSAAPK